MDRRYLEVVRTVAGVGVGADADVDVGVGIEKMAQDLTEETAVDSSE